MRRRDAADIALEPSDPVRDLRSVRAEMDDFTLCAYGVGIGIRAHDSNILAQVLSVLPPGWKPVRPRRVERWYAISLDRADGLEYALQVDARSLLRTPHLGELLDLLVGDLQLYLAEHARGYLFIHAGVVGWHGRAIVVPGHSFSGKTTLVEALVRHGATYYSDEYAILDRRGRVHPFPCPLHIREERFEDRQVPIEDLGGVRGTKPLPIGLIVSTTYRAARRWRPRRLSRGEALLELLAHTASARIRPAFALAVLSRAVSEAIPLKGLRGEADETAREILSRYVFWATGGS